MQKPATTDTGKGSNTRRRILPPWLRKRYILLAALLGAIVLTTISYSVRKHSKNAAATFAVRRGNLPITIVQAGSFEALESQEIRSEVKGYQGTKILSIVEEGYQVTEEDVKKGKVLVELDSSDIKQRLATQDIEFQSRIASRTEAQQAYEIQYNQNNVDIKGAEQKVRFALLDFEKYLGTTVAREVIAKMGLPEWKHAEDPTSSALASATNVPNTLAATETKSGASLTPVITTDGQKVEIATANKTTTPEKGSATAVPVTTTEPRNAELGRSGSDSAVSQTSSLQSANSQQPAATVDALIDPARSPKSPAVVIDFSQYAKVELLGDGEAQQKLREAKDSLLVAEKEKSSVQEKLTGTERLYQKGFVTRTEYETGKIEFDQVDLKVQKAATTLNLFVKYDFPKSAEEFVSKYEEAAGVLERTRKEAVSKLAQARAKMMSAESAYKIVSEQRKDLLDQLEKCVLRAKKAGLVIYGGNNDGYYYSEERIREGALIRERQPIITIPDMTTMAVKVKIHESHIKKVKLGMKARVRVDAFADKILEGEVVKVGVLPDNQTRWMSADMKVYLTTVKIPGTREWLKPGMSGKVEILANELKNVLYVPMQAVVPEDNQKICYVMRSGKPERQVVNIGQYNDDFIEILEGLKESEQVLLRLPDDSNGKKDGSGGKDNDSSTKDKKDKDTAPSKSPVVPASTKSKDSAA